LARGNRYSGPTNANAYAERWVRTLRTDCLDRILILGRRHLEHVLRVYRRHYNEHRPHRALDLLPPEGPIPLRQSRAPQLVRRRDLLGGLIHEYKSRRVSLRTLRGARVAPHNEDAPGLRPVGSPGPRSTAGEAA
jgi:Integrase core domain